jgi:hypothetical protein
VFSTASEAVDVQAISCTHWGFGSHGFVVVIVPLHSSKCDRIAVSHEWLRRAFPAFEYLRKRKGAYEPISIWVCSIHIFMRLPFPSLQAMWTKSIGGVSFLGAYRDGAFLGRQGCGPKTMARTIFLLIPILFSVAQTAGLVLICIG